MCTLLTLDSPGLNRLGDFLPENKKGYTPEAAGDGEEITLCLTELGSPTFPFLFGEGQAIGQVGLPVRAYVGYGVLPLGYSQQGCAIVDERLPALLPEVNNVLSSVFLKVGEPAQT